MAERAEAVVGVLDDHDVFGKKRNWRTSNISRSP